MSRIDLRRVVAVFACCLVLFYMSETAQAQGIGGEFAFTIGAQNGPFETGTGFYLAGEVGLPLLQLGPGKLMGLVNIGFARTDDELTFTSPVLGPITADAEITTLSIVAGLKYKLLLSNVIQPYIVAGPGFNVLLCNTEGNPLATGDDDENLVCGIAPIPGELADRGFPSGEGEVKLGLHTGLGVDVNLTQNIFVGAEGRFNYVGDPNGDFWTFGGRAGFRF